MIKLKTTSSPKKHVDQFIYRRDFNENSLNLLNKNLFETSWDSLENITDPNESNHKFLKLFVLFTKSIYHYDLLQKIKKLIKLIKTLISLKELNERTKWSEWNLQIVFSSKSCYR